MKNAERTGYHVRVDFEDGSAGNVDLRKCVKEGTVFERLSDRAYVATMRVECGTLVWGNGEVDIAPEALYEESPIDYSKKRQGRLLISEIENDAAQEVRGPAQHFAEADPLSASLFRGWAVRRGLLRVGDSAGPLSSALCPTNSNSSTIPQDAFECAEARFRGRGIGARSSG